MVDPPARQLGKYPIVREIARGGMGIVYEGRHPELGHPLAIKVLKASPTRALAERFRREAQVLGRLALPNLVRVYDVGEDGGRPFLVMDLIDGESLGARLKREGPLPLREAAEIGRTLARAMAEVHAHGVLHRDLKPDNVLQDKRGEILLTDFGLARDEHEERERLTQTGQMLGTPGYMAPEQAGGEIHDIGPCTDVYGLGATLYDLLTGQAPFTGKTQINVISAVLRQPPQPPIALRPELDAELNAICLRCLEKEPADRYASASELADALDEYLTAPPASTRRSRGGLLPLSLLVGAAGVVSLVWAMRTAPPPDRPSPTPVASVSPPSPTPNPTPTTSVAPTPSSEIPSGWHQIELPEPGPGPREGHERACAHVPGLGFLLFSGHDGTYDDQRLGDLWTWRGAWQRLPDDPGGPVWRYGQSAAYDEHRQVLVVIGGAREDRNHLGDGTWEYNLSRGRWRRLDQHPPGMGKLGWAAAVYDPDERRVLLCAAHTPDGPLNSALFSWDGETWTQLAADGEGPDSRQSSGVAYDRVQRRLVLHGGWAAGGARGDLWQWSSAGWQPIESEGTRPARRRSHCLVALSSGDLFLFGGEGEHGLLGDTWILSQGRWRQVSTQGGPSARLYHGAAWDPERGVVSIYGGRDSENRILGDLWEYRPRP